MEENKECVFCEREMKEKDLYGIGDEFFVKRVIIMPLGKIYKKEGEHITKTKKMQK